MNAMFLRIVGALTLAYSVYLVTAVMLDGPHPALPINALVLLSLATGCAVLASQRHADKIREAHRQNAVHFNHRLDSMTNMIIDGFARLEHTQEIPRIHIPATPTVYQATAGWDPKVLEIGHRLSDKLHAPAMRQED